jgi:hypothetical protein
LLEEVTRGRGAGGTKEVGGVPTGRDVSLGFCGLKGSSNAGANVLIKDADTSERMTDAL